MATMSRGIRSVPEGLSQALPNGVGENLEDFLRDTHRLWRQALSTGLIGGEASTAAVGSPTAGAPGASGPTGAPGPPGSGPSPDLTPPPTPSGVTVTAGLDFVFITTAAPTFTQGNGYARTRVYGAKYPGSGSLPTFASAALQHEFVGQVGSFASELGTQWHIWVTWLTNDAVESVTPEGGTNGHQVTTGKIGSSDLGPLVVLAGNLAAGSVTADKAALDIGGENLLGNNSFEVDSDANGIADGWTLYNNSPGTEPSVYSLVTGRITGLAQRHAWTGSNTTTKGVFPTSLLRGGVWLPLQTYVVSWYAKASAATTGMAIYWNIGPASTTAIKNPALTTSWQRYAYRITWGASVETLGRFFVSITSGAAATGSVDIDDVQVELGDTLSGYFGKLATNTIVAGDGAIANLAITNALMGVASITNANIVTVSASKLLAGSIAVGEYIQSTGFLSGSSGWRLDSSAAEFGSASIRDTLLARHISAGFITATMIDSRGLSIKDAAGTVIFSAGVPLGNDSATSLGFNPTFAAWSGTYPDTWSGWSGPAPTKETSIVLGSPYSTRWVVSSDTGMARQVNFPAPLPAGTFLAGSFSMYMVSNAGGGKPGYLVRLFTNAALTTYVDNVFPITDQTVSGWQKMPFTATANGAAIHSIVIYQMASWTGIPGGALANGSVVLFGPMTFEVKNPITSANASTYIASAAIGSAQIGSVNADTITTGSLRGINVNSSSYTTKGSYLTVAATGGATTLNVKDTTDFPASGSGWIIDTTNDAFTYTGKTATTLTGGSGVLAHSSGATIIPQANGMVIDSATNEMRFFGDRGDGTILELASIGKRPFGSDFAVGYFGASTMTGAVSALVAESAGSSPTLVSYSYGAGSGISGNAFSAAGVRGFSTTGQGGFFTSSTGYGVYAEGNNTKGAIYTPPLALRPSNRTAGQLTMMYTTGGGVGSRTADPLLMYTDGTDWRYISGGAIFTG